MIADSRLRIADSKSQIADGELQIADGKSQMAIGDTARTPPLAGHTRSGAGQPPAISIIAFCCHYCAYAAADLAGSLRLQYPPDVNVVKLPCTGKLDVLLVLHAFEHGADGVMVAGCLEGDCHYRSGNLNAKRRVNYVKRLLQEIGLEAERVRMFNMSSAMARAWAEAVTEMDEQIRRLGPSPLRERSTVNSQQ